MTQYLYTCRAYDYKGRLDTQTFTTFNGALTRAKAIINRIFETRNNDIYPDNNDWYITPMTTTINGHLIINGYRIVTSHPTKLSGPTVYKVWVASTKFIC